MFCSVCFSNTGILCGFYLLFTYVIKLKSTLIPLKCLRHINFQSSFTSSILLFIHICAPCEHIYVYIHTPHATSMYDGENQNILHTCCWIQLIWYASHWSDGFIWWNTQMGLKMFANTFFTENTKFVEPVNGCQLWQYSVTYTSTKCL